MLFFGCLAFKLWKKLLSRLAELFLTLEYASHAIWEGQVKSEDFTLVEKFSENQLNTVLLKDILL